MDIESPNTTGPVSRSSKEIQVLGDTLAAIPEVEIAILFGSLARGLAGPSSDVDIAIAQTRPLTTDEKIKLIESLSLVTGRPVDLVDLREAGEPLLGQILQGRLLVIRDRRLYAELIKRHLFDSADFLPYRERLLTERRRAWTGI